MAPLFHPVIFLPKKTHVFDLRRFLPEEKILKHRFGIGKYNEKRRGTYTASLFRGGRDIHMGIDLFAPVGTQVHAFEKGKVFLLGYNPRPFDYGVTLITEHDFDGLKLYALFGHLSKESLRGKKRGEKFGRGELLAWIGDRSENGGWLPHLHFQLSFEKPKKRDMPGVVPEKDLPLALLKYPDPRLVLGRIY